MGLFGNATYRKLSLTSKNGLYFMTPSKVEHAHLKN